MILSTAVERRRSNLSEKIYSLPKNSLSCEGEAACARFRATTAIRKEVPWRECR